MPADSNEFTLIEWIRARAEGHPRVPLGIGDDAASVSFAQPSDCLVASDMLVEGVHFLLPAATPSEVGRKALAVNLSDLAAMAARPLAAVVNVALPRSHQLEFAHELLEGLANLADEFDTAVAGGDTNIWNGPCVISVALLGEAVGADSVRRSGARVGDWILTTGTFGASLAGKHLSFQPRVIEARQLHETVSLHAMIDVSDGLVADLHHILKESHVGCLLQAEAVPISNAAQAAADRKTPLEHALGDGEDFELLFTVSPEEGRRLIDSPPFATRLTHIGEITEGKTCEIEDSAGNRALLAPTGWRHTF